MNPGQATYLRQCYRDYKASIGSCERCGPPRAPILKRWVDAVLDVGDYVNSIVPEGNEPFHVADKPLGDIAWWGGKATWRGGVFQGDNYDGGPVKWYWRLPDEERGTPRWANTPADALIACVNAYEKSIGAFSGAPGLTFTVRIPACADDDSHDWKFLYTGRHGSDKGDDFYECRHCGEEKRE